MQQLGEERTLLTFDEVSMERSKNFTKALRELKNLRSQLYSAAEYCEKSYVHNEQKQMVLDNLKDYTLRALVNAVDHLGTVAYKITDLFEQQKSDISTLDSKVICLDQRLKTCQNYTDKEGLREQQFSVVIPRYHKHYVLPGPVNKRTWISSKANEASASGPKYMLEKPRPYGTGTPPSKTLCWHLATETKSGLNDATNSSASSKNTIASTVTQGMFHLSDAEATVSSIPAIPGLLPLVNGGVLSNTNPTPLVSLQQDKHDPARPLSVYKSFGHVLHDAPRTPARSKSVLSALFGRKSLKSKAG